MPSLPLSLADFVQVGLTSWSLSVSVCGCVHVLVAGTCRVLRMVGVRTSVPLLT